MNERLTAIFEHDGDDGCGALNPKLDNVSRGTALAEAPVQFFEAATASAIDIDWRLRGSASTLIACGYGFRFER